MTQFFWYCLQIAAGLPVLYYFTMTESGRTSIGGNPLAISVAVLMAMACATSAVLITRDFFSFIGRCFGRFSKTDNANDRADNLTAIVQSGHTRKLPSRVWTGKQIG